MPIDPATLRGYVPPTPPKHTRRTWGRALIIAAGGSVFFAIFFAVAMGSPTLTRAYHITLVIAVAVCMLERAYSGLREDGFLGAIHRLRNPFGNIMLGDDVEHLNRYTVAATAALAVGAVLAGVLAIV